MHQLGVCGIEITVRRKNALEQVPYLEVGNTEGGNSILFFHSIMKVLQYPFYLYQKGRGLE